MHELEQYPSQSDRAAVLGARVATLDVASMAEIADDLVDLEDVDLADLAEIADDLAPVAACSACNTVLYSGRCFNLGACELADSGAVRSSASRRAASSWRPSAWTRSGGVD